MNILELHLRAGDLLLLETFYAASLGLSVTTRDPSRIGFQVGSSRLVFDNEEGFTGRYHVAFDVPNNQLAEARAWLEARTPLVQSRAGVCMFHSDGWNADQFYFLDPAGNILELIARHTAPTASEVPFGSASLLAITEIGLAAPDVPATVAWLGTALDLALYGDHSETFTPVGDETGLLIVVRTGREWFPDTGVAAIPLPTGIVVEGEQPRALAVPELPYTIDIRRRS